MVGLVPPPFHGQAIMTLALFESDLSPVRTEVVEARFNHQIDEVSRFRWNKITELFRVAWKTIQAQRRSRAPVLYYTPGSAKWVPFIKDVLLLSVTRPFFRRTLLHYHSGGLPAFLETHWWSRILGRWAYGRGAWALALTPEVAVPGLDFGAARELALPNGIIDAPEAVPFRKCSSKSGPFRVVFIGNLYREKGILDAVLALTKAAESEPEREFHFQVAGGAPDEAVKKEFENLSESGPVTLEIEWLGTVGSEAKWSLLAEADAMLFPSYYGSENFPLVLLEAMASGLPIVATEWRGIPSIVTSEENGLLVKVGDIDAMAQALLRLSRDAELYQKMSATARTRFEQKYAWPQFLARVRDCFQDAIN